MDASVEDTVSKDLEKIEELVFQIFSLHPEEPISYVVDEYDVKKSVALEVTDSLQDKGLIEAVDSDDYCWRVTESGRLLLLRCFYNARLDVMRAELEGEPEPKVKELELKRKGFQIAFDKCEELFGGDE